MVSRRDILIVLTALHAATQGRKTIILILHYISSSSVADLCSFVPTKIAGKCFIYIRDFTVHCFKSLSLIHFSTVYRFAKHDNTQNVFEMTENILCKGKTMG